MEIRPTDPDTSRHPISRSRSTTSGNRRRDDQRTGDSFTSSAGGATDHRQPPGMLHHAKAIIPPGSDRQKSGKFSHKKTATSAPDQSRGAWGGFHSR